MIPLILGCSPYKISVQGIRTSLYGWAENGSMTEILHVTPGAAGYRKGCRCDACTEGNRLDVAARRAKRNGGTPLRQGHSAAVPVDLPAVVMPESTSNPSEGHTEPLTAPGQTEVKTEARIEEIWKCAGMGRWDAEAEAWEDQALQAARAIDQATASGKVHQTPAQWRLLNDAVRALQLKLQPVRVPVPADAAAAPAAAAAAGDDDDDDADFLASLTPQGHPSLRAPEYRRGWKPGDVWDPQTNPPDGQLPDGVEAPELDSGPGIPRHAGSEQAEAARMQYELENIEQLAAARRDDSEPDT